MRRLLVVLLALSLAFAFAIQMPAQAQSNALIVAGRFTDVITLDPGRAFETTNLIVHHATYETLLNINADDLSKIVPGLAESYS
ncbi:MAG: ABC transporter substrate-binding protein, partial [Candidatus Thermofonsia Clade 1 bacterium]